MNPEYVVVLVAIALTMPWCVKKYKISDFKPGMAIAAALFLLFGIGLFFCFQT